QLLDKSPLSAFTFQYNDKKDICINYVNQALQDISPLPIEELIGYPILSLFSIEDVHEVERACETILIDETKQPSFYIRTQGKHGTLQLLGNIRSFTVNHQHIGICFLTDITQQQKDTMTMQQNMQDGYMSTLVAGLVHDFRNILTSIMGTAEVMQFTQTDTKTIEDLELIIQASEQGARMVSNLLGLGKASQQESQQETHDVVEALRNMVNLVRIQLPNSILLTLEIPDTLPPAKIRLTQLEQILMNLIKNASEASPEGGAIDVKISTGLQNSPSETNKPAMMIEVKDHGIGIAEDDLDNVTKSFWTSRKDSGGTGLGLAMVQRIARQHNGSFHIDSTLGEGTCITLSFPLMDEEPHSSPVKEHKKTSVSLKVTSSQQDLNVLLVDDNPDVIQVHKHMLERLGHHVSLANDGEEALACFQKDPDYFHAIVTDFIMPKMDGMDLCQHIREQNTSIPLLMITAFGDNDKLQQSNDLNIEMLSKPVSFQGLKESFDMIQTIEKV
ncbi:MAG: ATP-binding protein, partial [Mariprofundaceae bacterium]|nr:ATP-binding protein [Mariprofundaceae bacterium]